MAAQQSTTMVLEVDLQCSKCYKKVKKVVCKFPEIRDQVYDLKQNTVTIKVVCCCPEKLKQKICCKGGKSIKSIEIKPPGKKDKDKPDTKSAGKKKVTFADQLPKPKPKPTPSELPAPKPTPPQPAPKSPEVTPGYPIPIPFGVCCGECYEGRGGGPCYGGHYGRPVCNSWGEGGCNRGYYGSRTCDYFTEENPSACTIM